MTPQIKNNNAEETTSPQKAALASPSLSTAGLGASFLHCPGLSGIALGMLRRPKVMHGLVSLSELCPWLLSFPLITNERRG